MIGRLSGVLSAKNPPQVLAAGSGLRSRCADEHLTNPAGQRGEKVTLLTQFIVREDGQFLCGFYTEAEFCFSPANQDLRRWRTHGAGSSPASRSTIWRSHCAREAGRLTKVPASAKNSGTSAARTQGKLADALPSSVPATEDRQH